MASLEVLVAFAIATLTYAAIPGPGIVYITAQAMTRDTGAAWRAALGLHVGGYVILLGTAAGLTTLFATVPLLYDAFKLLGALYLIWLGIQIMVLRVDAQAVQPRVGPREGKPDTFLKSVFIEILNPTTAIFYVAFLPQFVAPDADLPVWIQLMILGMVVNLVFSLPDFMAILLATRMRRAVTLSARSRRLCQWLGGSVLIGLGFRMALARD